MSRLRRANERTLRLDLLIVPWPPLTLTLSATEELLSSLPVNPVTTNTSKTSGNH